MVWEGVYMSVCDIALCTAKSEKIYQNMETNLSYLENQISEWDTVKEKMQSHENYGTTDTSDHAVSIRM